MECKLLFVLLAGTALCAAQTTQQGQKPKTSGTSQQQKRFFGGGFGQQGLSGGFGQQGLGGGFGQQGSGVGFGQQGLGGGFGQQGFGGGFPSVGGIGGGFPGAGGIGGGFPGAGGIGGGFPGVGVIGGGFPGAGGIGSVQAPPSTCRYWCKTPQGQAYCCESANQGQSLVGVKPGQCPPRRPVCPTTRFGPPSTCSNDGSCSSVDKCCYDTCLQEHVCKPPYGFGK